MLKRILKYKRIWLILLAPIGLLLTLLAEWESGWVETVHSRFIYPLFANSLGWLLSLFPFSVLELLIVLLGAGAIFYLVWATVGICRHRAEWKGRLYRLGLNVLATASIVYFGFVLFMGLNYHRASITEYLDLTVQKSTKEELYSLCERLVRDCNEDRAKLQEDENGVVLLSDGGFYETADAARKAYTALEKEIPVLQAADVRNKPLLSSKLFSMVLTTGIYIPFESGINVDVPAYTVPATMCHELTHFRGFMREDEANFLSYLACMGSERADFRYSGSLMAFEYAFDALYDEDRELAAEIAQQCGSGMIRDIRAEDDYWRPYRNTAVSEMSGEIYEGYLQSNNQQSGLKSYGEMIDLLLAYYREG
ncbi:MAG: DUF3810 domain-containing protein [Clostridia bacterium]|nr:DUF3810 domain-containing protein [Clostridia bacterium]